MEGNILDNLKKLYKLNNNITASQLFQAGFRYNKYVRNVYGKEIQLIITIDLEDMDWTYEVYHSGSKTRYYPWYNREYGSNKVVDKLDNRVIEEMEKMRKNHVFIKRRNRNGKRKEIR